MNKNTQIIFRITGILFFFITLIGTTELINITTSSWMYVINEDNPGWSLFFIISSFIFSSYFIFALLSTAQSGIFMGRRNYIQSVWNTGIFGLVLLSLYTSLQLITGLDKETQFFLVQSVIMLILYNVISFVCLKEEDSFNFKNLFHKDPNMKLSLQVYTVMTILIQLGSFLYAHKFID